jgi:DnaJ-class molecular chaperone
MSETQEVKEEKVEEKEEVSQPEIKTNEICKNCDGTGLADKKTMGNMAQIMCEPCKGSGRI